MAVVFPDAGERAMLYNAVYIFNNVGTLSKIKLFAGGGLITVDADLTLATLDAQEADFSGYSEVTRNDWTTPSTDGSGNAFTFCSSAIFQYNSLIGSTSDTVYGWYLVDGWGSLILAEEFAAPVTMDDDLDIITVAPKIYARQAT